MIRLFETLLNGLLVAGLLFPVFSVVTLCLAEVSYLQTGRRPSAVLIPMIGPVLLTTWLMLAGHHWGWIAVAWLADPATWHLRNFLTCWLPTAADNCPAVVEGSADLADENGRTIVGDSPDPHGD